MEVRTFPEEFFFTFSPTHPSLAHQTINPLAEFASHLLFDFASASFFLFAFALATPGCRTVTP